MGQFMDIQLYILFIGATVILSLIPGPNVALIVANSVAHGTRYGLLCVAGTSTAMIPQLLITIFAATIVSTLGIVFEWLRWLGVFYLLYLGISNWFTTDKLELELKPDKKTKTYKSVFWRGFWVSSINPKTLFFFAAFFPQFISTTGVNIFMQMGILALTFLIVISSIDILWAILAGIARYQIKKFANLRYKISSVFYLLAGLGLALARKP